MAQIIPVRCFTCGKTVSAIMSKMKTGTGLPLKRCCMRMIITQVDTDFMLDYPIKREYEHTRKAPDGTYRVLLARSEDPFANSQQIRFATPNSSATNEISFRDRDSKKTPNEWENRNFKGNTPGTNTTK